MKRVFLFLSIIVIINSNLFSQSYVRDSLRQLLQREKSDTVRSILFADLSAYYLFNKPDSAMGLALQGLTISQKAGFLKGVYQNLNRIGAVYDVLGNYPKALNIFIQSLKLSQKANDPRGISANLTYIADIYKLQGDYKRAIGYLREAVGLARQIPKYGFLAAIFQNVGQNYLELHQLDSAIFYTQKAISLCEELNNDLGKGFVYTQMGDILSEKGQNDLALHYYRLSIPCAERVENDYNLCQNYFGLTKLFEKSGKPDSVLFYANLNVTVARQKGFIFPLKDGSNFLSLFYEKRHNSDSALFYARVTQAANDSLFSQQKINQIQTLLLDEKLGQQERQYEIDKARSDFKNKIRLYGLLTAVVVFLSIAFILYRNNKKQKKANALLQKQKKEIEQQRKETQIEAALERVRSRTLAMQRSDELAETSVVLFKQLINLGIEPNRLYITIIKDDNGEAEFWITDEDGSKISMAYEDNLNNNPSFKKMYDGWKQQKKSLVIDMKGKELQQYLDYLMSIHVPFKGGLEQKRRVQHLAYFSKGFIGMASPEEQSAATLQLLERFAYVFNLTFTRFNDLKIAEAHALQAEQDLLEIKAARKKAEDTLNELQATQKQLIQSEKMASLGELTAGIAHEIQNPLNFVNNFSEINAELIEDAEHALNKGNMDEAKSVLADVKQNEQKINLHGKRADAIVKGMLQHSRASTGKKEPTDINALADEYLRLSYHGLRAKDKSFNAIIETHFDLQVGKVNVVGQDIGRVLLNLFNNAFYAVNEKKRLLNGTFEPIVTVATKKTADKIEIIVKDNGTGIPEKVLDKIYQPFFTTKPTGEGTGLGLSLSYDIITKGHNGTIKIDSEEGEYAIFTIELPLE